MAAGEAKTVEVFVLTDDLVVGRVTFEIDDGVVTAAHVESEAVDVPAEREDQALAQLQADAVERLVTVDNFFDGADPFSRIDVASVIGGDPDRPLEARSLELIAAALGAEANLNFIDDADAVIDELFDRNESGAAVVAVDDLRIDGPSAEIEMRLWCGSLCAVFLTYEAELTDSGWQILGTTGPIAVA